MHGASVTVSICYRYTVVSYHRYYTLTSSAACESDLALRTPRAAVGYTDIVSTLR